MFEKLSGRSAENRGFHLLAYAHVMCEHCYVATAERLAGVVVSGTSRGDSVDMIWSVLAITSTSLTLVLCIFVGLSILVWGLTYQSLPYLVMLILLTLSEALMVVFHTLTLQTLYIEGSVFFRFKEFSILFDQLLLFGILLELACRWTVAVIFVAKKDEISNKTETILRACFYSVGATLALLVSVLAMLYQFHPSSSFGVLTSRDIVTSILRCFSALFAVFLVVASIYMLRKKKKLERQLIQLVIVFSILCVCVLFGMAVFFARKIGVGDVVVFVPRWFEYGFLFVVFRIAQSWALLYTFFQASRSIHLSRTRVTHPLTQSLLEDKDGVEMTIPARYVI